MERIEDGQCSEEGRMCVYYTANRFGLSCSLSVSSFQSETMLLDSNSELQLTSSSQSKTCQW